MVVRPVSCSRGPSPHRSTGRLLSPHFHSQVTFFSTPALSHSSPCTRTQPHRGGRFGTKTSDSPETSS
jgi:hypothetical protein